MKTGFLFVVADHILFGQLCTNTKSDRNLLLCLKVTQCSTSEIGDAPLYNSCYSTDPSYDNRTIASTLKMQIRTVQCLRAQINASDDYLKLVEQMASSCHFTSSKSAWKSTPKCTWICWRMWWSPGAIRWPVADPGRGSRTRRRHTSKETKPWIQKECNDFVPFSHWPSSPNLNPLDYFVWSYVENITNMTFDITKASLIAAIRRLFDELPPALVEKTCSQFRIRIEAVVEAEVSYIE